MPAYLKQVACLIEVATMMGFTVLGCYRYKRGQSHVLVNSKSILSLLFLLSLSTLFKFLERRSIFNLQNHCFWHKHYTLNTGLTYL